LSKRFKTRKAKPQFEDSIAQEEMTPTDETLVAPFAASGNKS